MPPIIYSENKKEKLRAKYHSLGKMSDIVINCENCLENFINIKQYGEGITDILDKSLYVRERYRKHKEEIKSRKVVLSNQFFNFLKPEEEERKVKRKIDPKTLLYRHHMKEKFSLDNFHDNEYEGIKEYLKRKEIVDRKRHISYY